MFVFVVEFANYGRANVFRRVIADDWATARDKACLIEGFIVDDVVSIENKGKVA